MRNVDGMAVARYDEMADQQTKTHELLLLLQRGCVAIFATVRLTLLSFKRNGFSLGFLSFFFLSFLSFLAGLCAALRRAAATLL